MSSAPIRRRLVALSSVCALLVVAPAVSAARAAATVHVMISGGLSAPYKVLVAQWEKATGNTVDTAYGPSMGQTPGAIPSRLARGEQADVVIMVRTALDALVHAGKVVKGSETDLARSRIGMAVRAGAPVPDISTEAKFRQVLLDAKSIAYSDSASGVYISGQMLRKLGIQDAVASKSKTIPATPVGEIVAKGEAEIGFQQMSELLPVKGITVVGPIPESVQLLTTFSAGVVATSRNRRLARDLIMFLASPAARATLRAAGLDPIE